MIVTDKWLASANDILNGWTGLTNEWPGWIND
jgi:hypothetical protein